MRFYFPLGLMKEQIKHSRTSTYETISKSSYIYTWIINKKYLNECAPDAQRYNDAVIDLSRENMTINKIKSPPQLRLTFSSTLIEVYVCW